MKTVKLFVVAAVATVAFASCGGGESTSTVTDTTSAVVVDSTPVAPVETAPVEADSIAADSTK